MVERCTYGFEDEEEEMPRRPREWPDPLPEGQTLVVAGSHTQFRQYLRAWDLVQNNEGVTYIHSEQQLLGRRRPVRVVLYGEYWQNPVFGSQILRDLMSLPDVQVDHQGFYSSSESSSTSSESSDRSRLPPTSYNAEHSGVPCEFYVHGVLWKKDVVPPERMMSGAPLRVVIAPKMESIVFPLRPKIRAIRFKNGKLPPVKNVPLMSSVEEVMFVAKEYITLGGQHNMTYHCSDPRVVIGEEGRLFLR